MKNDTIHQISQEKKSQFIGPSHTKKGRMIEENLPIFDKGLQIGVSSFVMSIWPEDVLKIGQLKSKEFFKI